MRSRIGTFCRWLLGVVFLFSSGVKLLDPIGTAYKIQEYGIGLGWDTMTMTMTMALALSLAELALAAMLLLGLWRKTAVVASFVVMVAYTMLTGWAWMTNGVADCGCFGDAIHLSNAQTFGKNIVLLIVAGATCWSVLGSKSQVPSPKSVNSKYFILILLCGVGVGIRCVMWEPIVDFRPYHVGQHIPTAMGWHGDTPPEILDFDLSVLPDSCYEDSCLAMLLVVPYLEHANRSCVGAVNNIYDMARQEGIPFVCVTASSADAIHDWCYHTGASYEFAFMDAMELRTIARTSPALLLLRGGTILRKWGCRSIPEPITLKNIISL